MLRSFKLNQRLIIFGVCVLLSLVSIAGISTPASAALRLKAVPSVFDPTGTHIVQSVWTPFQGSPSNSDPNNYALLLTKLGPTGTNAASGATISGVLGISLTEIGWDVRDDSHCGAGAPRFNVVTSDNVTHFIGCNSPAPTTNTVLSPDANGYTWTQKRYDPTQAFPPIAAGSTVQTISIVFDEGIDPPAGGAKQGYAFLDNIDINGTLIGQP